jgi:hypothetical protein
MALSELQHLIENSALSGQDKDMWLHTMEMLDDEQAATIVEAAGDDPHELDVLTRNLKLKQIAIASGDADLLQEILGTEKEHGDGDLARAKAYGISTVAATLVARRVRPS